MRKKIFATAAICLLVNFVFAGEGMWMPQLLQSLNEKDMQQMGLQLKAEDIFSVNNGSLKDAVVQFGSGCTGEIISDKGLVLTNHHCGYSQIQSLSTIEKNYLNNGYWAQKNEDELPCTGLTVTFIKEIRDVSDDMLKKAAAYSAGAERDSAIKQMGDSLSKAATANTHYKTFVRPFFYGNKYYLFITEVFTDIRFVGAPPESIGKFGGDTDNRMWPRHTGDFSLFRIYADKDNKPATYNKDNVPFKPLRSLVIQTKGVLPGDYAMTYGFPGRTNEYLSVAGVNLIYGNSNPAKIKIRDKKLLMMWNAMLSNDTIKLKYSSKYSTLSNYHKKWKGENLGIKKFNVLDKKKDFEKKFQQWANSSENKNEYGNLLAQLNSLYDSLSVYSYLNDYMTESLMGVEWFSQSARLFKLLNAASNKTDSVLFSETAGYAKGQKGFYKNYDKKLDQEIAVAMQKIYFENVKAVWYPSSWSDKNFENNLTLNTEKLFSKTILSDTAQLSNILNSANRKKILSLMKDPLLVYAGEIFTKQNEITKNFNLYNSKVTSLMQQYMKGQMAMQTDKKFYPDANSTLRLSYGKVGGVTPRDGITYNYFTTLDGIMEKADSNDVDFKIPSELKALYDKKDFGPYGVNGTVPVAFITSNHTTGGNSGSPLLNAKGELIGLNFDRMWEGNMSDIYFSDEICRNIAVDVRYVLFIIDKLGNCHRLIDEMKLN